VAQATGDADVPSPTPLGNVEPASSLLAAQGKSQMSSSVRDTVEEVRLERPPYRRR
jgi:hypothetical protein